MDLPRRTASCCQLSVLWKAQAQQGMTEGTELPGKASLGATRHVKVFGELSL